MNPTKRKRTNLLGFVKKKQKENAMKKEDIESIFALLVFLIAMATILAMPGY